MAENGPYWVDNGLQPEENEGSLGVVCVADSTLSLFPQRPDRRADRSATNPFPDFIHFLEPRMVFPRKPSDPPCPLNESTQLPVLALRFTGNVAKDQEYLARSLENYFEAHLPYESWHDSAILSMDATAGWMLCQTARAHQKVMAELAAGLHPSQETLSDQLLIAAALIERLTDACERSYDAAEWPADGTSRSETMAVEGRAWLKQFSPTNEKKGQGNG